MEGAKQMLEGKLQDAGVQLMECERQLAEAVGGGGSAGRSPKAGNGRVGHRDSAAQVPLRTYYIKSQCQRPKKIPL